MPQQSLQELIESLSPSQQEAVRQFVEYLQQRNATEEIGFLAAVDEFMEEHPRLLQLLAK